MVEITTSVPGLQVANILVVIIWIQIFYQFSFKSKRKLSFSLFCLVCGTITLVSSLVNLLTVVGLIPAVWNTYTMLGATNIYVIMTVIAMVLMGKNFYPPWSWYTPLFWVVCVLSTVYTALSTADLALSQQPIPADTLISLSVASYSAGISAIMLSVYYTLHPLIWRDPSNPETAATAVGWYYLIGIGSLFALLQATYYLGFCLRPAQTLTPSFQAAVYTIRMVGIWFYSVKPAKPVLNWIEGLLKKRVGREPEDGVGADTSFALGDLR